MAQCHRHLGHVEKALHFYQRYLNEWDRLRPDVEAPYRSEIEGHIAGLAEELRESTEELRKQHRGAGESDPKKLHRTAQRTS